MSAKPDAIQQDVADKALRLTLEFLGTGPRFTDAREVSSLVSRAILAERERCACVVERNADLALGSANTIRAVRAVAASIRKGEGA